jgi:hypothetical protein
MDARLKRVEKVLFQGRKDPNPSIMKLFEICVVYAGLCVEVVTSLIVDAQMFSIILR